MSRIRHRGHKSHHALGGSAGESKVGNPNIFKLAEGHSIGHVHGKSAKGHLGVAHGGKVHHAKHRAHGGGADVNPHPSSALAKGGKAHHHKTGGHVPLHHAAVGHSSGIHHAGRHHEAGGGVAGGHHRGRHKA